MASKRVIDVQPTSHVSRLVKAIDIAMSQENNIKLPDGQFGFGAVIETENTRLSTDTVDFEYDISFDDDFVPNEAEIRIYNLSEQTISNFKEDNDITITAGYGDDVGIICKGVISNVKTEPDGVDKVTIINVIDSLGISGAGEGEMSFSEGTSASTILKALLDRAGLPIEVFNIGRDYTYNKSVTVSGTLGEEIKKYAEVCGDSVWVNKQRIYCRPLLDGDNIHFTVSAATGMIDSPKYFLEKTKSEIYEDRTSGYDITMLAQHRMTTAAIVDVDSKYASGAFRVKSGTHTYDGLSATTEIHAVELISTVIVPEDSVGDEYSNTGGLNSDVINKAVEWAISIADDDSHRYSQEVRWGPHYDCSSFTISAYQQAGVPVKDGGATYTGDMLDVFLRNNFKNVTSSCNLSTGAGMRRGDVLLNVQHHAAMVQEDGGTTVEARGTSYGIVKNVSYRNYPWDYVLRYDDPNATASGDWIKGHTATTYGYRGDDNGICGWNGINYHNISGCHVAIPTYCVKQANCYNSAWAKQDFPEFANGYGTVIELRSPDTGKTVKAVAADSGNFGPHNTYNHNTAVDMPPNTYKALGLGENTYDIEYRVVGHVDSWNGEQL